MFSQVELENFKRDGDFAWEELLSLDSASRQPSWGDQCMSANGVESWIRNRADECTLILKSQTTFAISPEKVVVEFISRPDLTNSMYLFHEILANVGEDTTVERHVYRGLVSKPGEYIYIRTIRQLPNHANGYDGHAWGLSAFPKDEVEIPPFREPTLKSESPFVAITAHSSGLGSLVSLYYVLRAYRGWNPLKFLTRQVHMKILTRYQMKFMEDCREKAADFSNPPRKVSSGSIPKSMKELLLKALSFMEFQAISRIDDSQQVDLDLVLHPCASLEDKMSNVKLSESNESDDADMNSPTSFYTSNKSHAFQFGATSGDELWQQSSSGLAVRHQATSLEAGTSPNHGTSPARGAASGVGSSSRPVPGSYLPPAALAAQPAPGPGPASVVSTPPPAVWAPDEDGGEGVASRTAPGSFLPPVGSVAGLGSTSGLTRQLSLKRVRPCPSDGYGSAFPSSSSSLSPSCPSPTEPAPAILRQRGSADAVLVLQPDSLQRPSAWPSSPPLIADQTNNAPASSLAGGFLVAATGPVPQRASFSCGSTVSSPGSSAYSAWHTPPTLLSPSKAYPLVYSLGAHSDWLVTASYSQYPGDRDAETGCSPRQRSCGRSAPVPGGGGRQRGTEHDSWPSFARRASATVEVRCCPQASNGFCPVHGGSGSDLFLSSERSHSPVPVDLTPLSCSSPHDRVPGGPPLVQACPPWAGQCTGPFVFRNCDMNVVVDASAHLHPHPYPSSGPAVGSGSGAACTPCTRQMHATAGSPTPAVFVPHLRLDSLYDLAGEPHGAAAAKSVELGAARAAAGVGVAEDGSPHSETSVETETNPPKKKRGRPVTRRPRDGTLLVQNAPPKAILPKSMPVQ